MIQCKYCGAMAQFPIDVSHRKECVKIPEGSYIVDLYQEVGGPALTSTPLTHDRRTGKDRRK